MCPLIRLSLLGEVQGKALRTLVDIARLAEGFNVCALKASLVNLISNLSVYPLFHYSN